MRDYLIAHLSDLHFSVDRYYSNDSKKQIRILESLSEEIKKVGPNLIVISGDLTDDHNGNSMVNAQEWLFSNYSNGVKNIGLMQNEQNVIIVPGNKDISNPGNMKSSYWLKKSHEVFNNTFSHKQRKQTNEIDGCKYYWIQNESINIFITCLDTSYLGKDHSQRNNNGLPIIEKRKILMKQSDFLLKCFSLGYQGKLNTNDGNKIDSSKFINSVKILISHHYIYFPENEAEYFIGSDDRNTIFGNFLLSDFDILLCGHKHRANYKEYLCKDKLDYRAKSRYLFNYLRLHLGCDALPLQFNDAGRMYSKGITLLIQLIIGKTKLELGKEDNILEEVFNKLNYGLENPDKFVESFCELIKKYDLLTCANITQEEIKSLVMKIRTEYTKDELKEINKLAKKTLNKYFKVLSKKKFYQIVVGSASKEITDNTQSSRAFNLYRVNKISNQTTIISEKYKYIDGIFELQSSKQSIIPYIDKNIL